MVMTRRHLALALVPLALTVAACGGSTSAGHDTAQKATVATHAARTSTSGVHRWHIVAGGAQGGTEIIATYPAPADNDLVTAVESYRHETQGSPVQGYVLVTIDNSHGTQPTYVNSLQAVTDGQQEDLTNANDLVSQWRDTLDVNADGAAYNDGVDLGNRLLNAQPVLPGAQGEMLFALPSPGAPQRLFMDDNQMQPLS